MHLAVGAYAVEKFAYLLLKLPNALFSASKTWRSRPVLYPCIDAICPELRHLEEAYPAIKQEYLAVRERLDRVPRYHEVDRLQYEPLWLAFGLEELAGFLFGSQTVKTLGLTISEPFLQQADEVIE
jgi:hypothetical protein